jgi:hypothetical protein
MTITSQNPVMPEPTPCTWADFFERTPPGRTDLISNLAQTFGGTALGSMNIADIQLYCESDTCNGLRFFRCIVDKKPVLTDTAWTYQFMTFRCRNCDSQSKTYAIAAKLKDSSGDGYMFKYGESPAFGPPTPSRVIKLLGPDRELFLMGRRCENQGLGIGAFVYYRRVVENQRNRVIDEIIRVAEKVGASQEVLDDLSRAGQEQHFTKAIEQIKHGLPQTLLINGHNPLTLLHSALSEGVHSQSDSDCLELAQSIRVVLTELAERLGQALKDEAELSNAVNRLQKVKSSPTNKK